MKITIALIATLIVLFGLHSCHAVEDETPSLATPPNCTYPANGTRALLVLDMQNFQATTYNGTIIEDCVRRALHVARRNDMLVIYTALGFRPGYPEINPNNIHMNNTIKANGRFQFGNTEGDFWPPTKPRRCEPVVIKKRYSGYLANDLEMILHSNGITEVVLVGIKTSGVILQVATESLDKDFRVSIIRQCVTDADTATASAVLDKIMPDRKAAVISIHDFVHSF